MKRSGLVMVLVCSFLLVCSLLTAQSKKNDIPVGQVPPAVMEVLQRYAAILKAETLEKCGEAFIEVAGGGLVSEDGKKLGGDLLDFSLKKDWSNFKFYADPLEVTRVNKSLSNGDGYGASAIKGTVYKIWIAKKKGGAGLPAPISIMVPEGHAWIKTPKVIGIGSL